MARRSPQKRRPAQVLFLILSIVVVLSMAIGYLLTALPPPPPPTPTPTQTPEVSGAAPVGLITCDKPAPAITPGDSHQAGGSTYLA